RRQGGALHAALQRARSAAGEPRRHAGLHGRARHRAAGPGAPCQPHVRRRGASARAVLRRRAAQGLRPGRHGHGGGRLSFAGFHGGLAHRRVRRDGPGGRGEAGLSQGARSRRARCRARWPVRKAGGQAIREWAGLEYGDDAGDRRRHRSRRDPQLAGARTGLGQAQAGAGGDVRGHLVDHPPMKTVRMPSGDVVPALGQGTWCMGEDPSLRAQEIASLRAGLDLGLRLVDTAEMYGEGRTETLVGEAIAGRRDEVFLVSKVYPHNASRKAMRKACTGSLGRLKTDRIDLYLLHWAGSVPLEETLDAFDRLQRDGHIRSWGVSNLDTAEMEELWALPGGREVQTDQVLYNLSRRGAEWELLPWLRE